MRIYTQQRARMAFVPGEDGAEPRAGQPAAQGAPALPRAAPPLPLATHAGPQASHPVSSLDSSLCAAPQPVTSAYPAAPAVAPSISPDAWLQCAEVLEEAGLRKPQSRTSEIEPKKTREEESQTQGPSTQSAAPVAARWDEEAAWLAYARELGLEDRAQELDLAVSEEPVVSAPDCDVLQRWAAARRPKRKWASLVPITAADLSEATGPGESCR